MKLLVAWIGNADLNAVQLQDPKGLGPIASAVVALSFERILLLANQERAVVEGYIDWLRQRTVAIIKVQHATLTSPTEFGEIYSFASAEVQRELQSAGADCRLTFHLSPGTPAMAAVWIILGKTRFPAELIESSRERGVRTASVPFEISAELVPDLLRQADQRLSNLSVAAAPVTGSFGDIIYRSAPMQRLVAKAQKAARRSVPILIEGESGTGKELLARAIHAESARSLAPLCVVNCGAIPVDLVESELFGHERGAFTGAAQQRIGFFEAANGGTLFLDEIGELPLRAQVKLLRVLQEGEVTRVGATGSRKIDVRIIAATHRDLVAEVADGRFREDLFYRLAVLVLKVPAVRDREGDLGPLIDGLLAKINEESRLEPGYVDKKLSSGGRNILMNHDWPGNVRELQNTLRRAAVWSDQQKMSASDIAEAVLPSPRAKAGRASLLDKDITNGIDLQKLISGVAKHYLLLGMETASGNKTKAAQLLGLPSYQTLSNWLRRYDLE
jgi:transcriptional regulator with PAS, ATPase and Fis domain